MSLSLQFHRLPIEGEDLWVWHVLADISSVREEDLKAWGWQLVEPVSLPFPLLALTTQLAATLPVLTAGQTVLSTWVRTADLTATASQPVILAFHHESHEPEQPSLFPYPPHPIGEVGLIWEDSQLHQYELAQLGEEGPALLLRLREAIDRVLAQPDISPLDEEIWLPVQQAARHIARLYWNVHRQQPEEAQEEGMVRTAAIVPLQDKKVKRTRGARQQITPLVARNPTAIPISPDPVTYAILHGLLSEKLYTLDEGHLIAEYRRQIPEGTVRLTIRPESQEPWEQFVSSLERVFGDEVVDTFCALTSLAYDHSPDDPTLPFYLNVDDILRVRRRKPSNRAFTPTQRAQVIAHCIALSRVEIDVQFPRRRGGRATTGYIKGVILELLKTVIGEYETLTGEVLWERREVKIGPWAKFAPFGPQTVQLFRTILEYHAQRQKYAKRFGRELTLQFFIQAQQGTTTPVGPVRVELSIEELLTLSEVTLSPSTQQPENPSRTRTMIEESFKQLHRDNVIGAFGRAIPQAPPGETGPERAARQARQEDERRRIDECAQGWWKLYLKERWYFAPPTHESRKELPQPAQP